MQGRITNAEFGLLITWPVFVRIFTMSNNSRSQLPILPFLVSHFHT